MARIARSLLKIFASAAGNNGQFGSGQLGTKLTTNDIDTLQALPAWAQGWLDAVLGASKFPPLEEFQSIHYVTTTQIAYLFQEGIPEWNEDTTYYDTSIVKEAGTFKLYGSLIDDNLGNALSDGASWRLLIDLAEPNPTYYLGGTSTGSANAQVVTPLTPLGYSRVAGNIVTFTAGFTNTTATTLNFSGTGVVAAKKSGGGGALVDLAASDITVGNDYSFLDNGTFYVLQVIVDPTAYLQKALNLSDVAIPATALANIGGAAKSANLSDMANVVTALTNLGGMAKSANLSDLANLATALTNLGFVTSAAVSGYVKLPGGIIIQWGGASVGGSGAQNAVVTLPLAFPNTFFRIAAVDVGAGIYRWGCEKMSLTQFRAYKPGYLANGPNTTVLTGAGSFHWIAVGN